MKLDRKDRVTLHVICLIKDFGTFVILRSNGHTQIMYDLTFTTRNAVIPYTLSTTLNCDDGGGTAEEGIPLDTGDMEDGPVRGQCARYMYMW